MIVPMMAGAYKFLLDFVAPVIFLFGLWLGGGRTFLTVAYTYIAMPLLEPLVGYRRGPAHAQGTA